MVKIEKICLNCQRPFTGRSDKKYCDGHCRSEFFFKKRKNSSNQLFYSIDRQLKINRRVLKKYNQEGKTTIRKEILINEGFNPKYFTHFWRNPKKKAYLFVYEYGFTNIIENKRQKFLLIKWQDYMQD